MISRSPKLVSRRGGRTGRARSDRSQREAESAEETVEEALLETFPASDPPSWTISRIGSPRKGND
jgi:hypothetical protein